MSYPDDIPSFAGLVGDATTKLSDPSLPLWAAKVNDEIINIATELGLNPADVATTVADRLKQLNLFGRAGKVFGGTPPATGTGAGGPFYYQAGIETKNSGTDSATTHVFQRAFPNGVITVLCTPSNSGASGVPALMEGEVTLSQFKAIWRNMDGTLGGSGISRALSYLAIGW